MAKEKPVPVYVVRRTSPVTWGCAILIGIVALGAILGSGDSKPKAAQSAPAAEAPANATPNPYPGIVETMQRQGLIVKLDRAGKRVEVDADKWAAMDEGSKKQAVTTVALAWDKEAFQVFDAARPAERRIARFTEMYGVEIYAD